MGEEADADWQEGLIEAGREDTERAMGGRRRKSAIDILLERKTRVGQVDVTFTVGRIKPRA